MKNNLTIFLSIVLCLCMLVGCGSNGGQQSSASENSSDPSVATSTPDSESSAVTNTPDSSLKTVTVGLIQLVEHPSLDEIREAIEARLISAGAEYGLTVNVTYQNAQNDQSMINSICRQFVNDKVDAIIAIATPAAQGAATSTKDIPVIFSAVTDPVSAGLVENMDAPEGNVTGTSDAIDVAKIFELADELTPGIQKIGFIYNKGEVNSVSVIKQASEYLDGKSIAYEEKTVTTAGEVQQTARALLETCDAIFAPIDNTVASAMNVLADEAIAVGKPVYVAADSMVNDGGLATVGVNYTQLGEQTADMALKALSGIAVSEIPVEVLKETTRVINKDTAAALGINEVPAA